MKIRLVRNLGTRDGYPPWKIGEQVDTDEAFATKLIALGLAEAVESPKDKPEQLKAIPPKPSMRAVPAASSLKTQNPAPAANKQGVTKDG